MLSRDGARLVVRSAMVRAPGLYEYVSAQRRFLWMDRLGKVHDRDLLALRNLLPNPQPLIVDVGANCGQTVLSVKRLVPDARLISFEPNPYSVAMLRRLQRRFPDLRVEAVGLGDRDDEADFHVPFYNGKAMSGLASFEHDSAATWLNRNTVLGFRPELLEIRVEKAAVRRLDDYDLDPDLIKIDVQGLEAAVVRGGMATIERTRPVIIIENPSALLLSELCSLDYRALEFHRNRLVASTGTATNQFLLPR